MRKTTSILRELTQRCPAISGALQTAVTTMACAGSALFGIPCSYQHVVSLDAMTVLYATCLAVTIRRCALTGLPGNRRRVSAYAPRDCHAFAGMRAETNHHSTAVERFHHEGEYVLFRLSLAHVVSGTGADTI